MEYAVTSLVLLCVKFTFHTCILYFHCLLLKESSEIIYYAAYYNLKQKLYQRLFKIMQICGQICDRALKIIF